MLRPRPAILGVFVVAVVSASACVNTQNAPKLARDEQVPFGLLKRDAPALVPSTNARQHEAVTLCFIEGNKLTTVEAQLTTPASLDDVVTALVDPPSTDPRGLRTAIDQAGLVSTVRLQAGVVQVDLNDRVGLLGGDNQLLAVAQLVCTLTLRPGVGQVAFAIGGTPIEVPRADGSLTAGPVSRDDYGSLL